MPVLACRDEGGRVKPKQKFPPIVWALCGTGVLIAVLLVFFPGRTQTDPVPAAQAFFAQHFDFYTLEDIGAVQNAVTPEFYALLNRIVTEGFPMGYHVCACAWTDSQEGWFKDDPVFTVVRNDGRRAVVRMDYDFEIGSSVEPKRTLLIMEWDQGSRRWRVADLEGPDNYPFVQNHEDWFEQMAEKGWFMGAPPGGIRD